MSAIAMNVGKISRHSEMTTIQAGRGLAAIAVLLYHSEITLALPKYFAEDIFPVLRGGDSGVHFFFVLSGFIMALAHWEDIGQARNPTLFVWKRFRRVYMPLWPVLTIVLISLIAMPQLAPGGPPSLGAIASAYLILPQQTQSLLAVEWTLTHEIVFYALFATLLWRPKIGSLLLTIWFVGAMLGHLLGLPYLLGFFFSPYNLLFLFGGISTYLLMRLEIPKPTLFLGAGSIIFASTWAAVCLKLFRSDQIVPIVLYGASVSLIIIGIVKLEASGRLRAHRALRFLGDASYSIYLVHFLVISVMSKIVTKLSAHINLPKPFWLACVALTSLFAGLLFYLLVEKPILKIVPNRPKFSTR